MKYTSNKYGKIWIETKDFFADEKIQQTIEKLLKSSLIKKIDERNNNVL